MEKEMENSRELSETEDVLSLAEQSETFCIYPFTHLATKTEGTFKLCCRSEPISNVEEESAVALWNGEKYKEVRKRLLRGEKPEECQDCWNLESMGTRSMRQRALRDFKGSRWNEYSPFLKGVPADGTVPFLPKSIELKLSNLCNLRCRMCHSVDSSSWVKDWPEVSDLMKQYNQWAYNSAEKQNVQKNPLISAFKDNDQWWKDFEKLVDSVELIEFAGGEPLIDPLHYRILDLLMRRAPHIRLKYSSNLTKLVFKGKHVFEYWKHFKNVSVYASVDGIHEVYDYIRTGTTFEDIMENMNQIIGENDVNFDEVAVACTIQVYNVFQLPQMMKYFSEKGVRFHSHRVTAPTFLNTQIMPAEMKEKATIEVTEFKQWLIDEKPYEKWTCSNLIRHIDDHINHMNGRDWTHLIPAFQDYTDRLDRLRKTDARKSIPELEPLFTVH